MASDLRPPRRFPVRRVVLIAACGLGLVYVLFVVTGYLWVNYGLKNQRVTLRQVAMFRWKEVRRDMAAQQLAQGKAALEAKDYPAAYLAFTSAVRNDPANVDARCLTAQFLLAAGAPAQAFSLLEAGLDLTPDDHRLMTQVLVVFTAHGCDDRVLKLLHGRFAAQLNGPHKAVLQTYELLATLNAQGAAAAKRLLEACPRIRDNPDSPPIIARVLWESGDRLKAIEGLADYVATGRGDFGSDALLAGWQDAAGMAHDAQQTAERACRRYPREIPPRLALIEVLPFGTPDWRRAVQAYLGDFGMRLDAILPLAEVAGRHGWVGLTRTLYVAGASHFTDLKMLALAHGDALTATAQFAQAQQVLAQIEAQIADGETRIIPPLRERQVVVAAALGDHAGAREFARRLAAALRNDSGTLEMKRRRFVRLRIPEAIEELARAAGGSGAPAWRVK